MTMTDDGELTEAEAYADCECGHYRVDHSPISEACVLCECEQFEGAWVDD